MRQLLETIRAHIPTGFQEVMAGSPAYVVPLSTYPAGYHCAPDTPLPFLGIASRKNYITLHHFGLYGDAALLRWFLNEYPNHAAHKPDIGKGCIRFKKMDDIPYQLIAELVSKCTVAQWIAAYEKALNR